MEKKTNVRYIKGVSEPCYREVFDVLENEAKLKIYIKSNLKIYSPVVCKEARLEREEFCATRFLFTVKKDDKISFNQGDAVCVKYDSKIIFAGYVFTKSRDKEGLIDVICYDSIRYLKNRRSYTRGSMSLEEVVRQIADSNAIPLGYVEKAGEMLPPVACDNVSLLDVLVKACKAAGRVSGKRYIVYDDGGYLSLRDEDSMYSKDIIDQSKAQNFFYKDSIDENVYNTVQLYNDTKKLNLRRIVEVSDEKNIDAWGKLILSKKAENIEMGSEEAQALLNEYNRINREIVIKGIGGKEEYRPGIKVYLKMEMGDLAFEGFVRCRKAVHIFRNNAYTADLYIDGSELG